MRCWFPVFNEFFLMSTSSNHGHVSFPTLTLGKRVSAQIICPPITCLPSTTKGPLTLKLSCLLRALHPPFPRRPRKVPLDACRHTSRPWLVRLLPGPTPPSFPQFCSTSTHLEAFIPTRAPPIDVNPYHYS